VGQILALLVLMGVINLEQSDVVKVLAVAVCELLVLIGILNNPNRNNTVAIRATLKSQKAARTNT
jgi:uncharacterized membrane protein